MELNGGSDSSFGLPDSYALHNAAEAGDESLVREILGIPGQLVTALEAEVEQVRLVTDLNEVDDSGCTALHISLTKGHLGVAELLLSNGAKLDLACEGSPPLIVAVCSAAHAQRRASATAAVKLLLANGARAIQRDDNGGTALHWAAALGMADIASILLSAAEAQNAQEAARMQAAMLASAATGSSLLPLIQPPSLLSLKDKQGNTALHLAASTPHREVLEVLLGSEEGKKAAGSINKLNQSPLHISAAHGVSWAVQQLLLIAPQAAELTDRYGNTPKQWAVSNRHLAALEILDPQLKGSSRRSYADDSSQAPTLIVAPTACSEHRTAPEPIVRGTDLPPENVRRLHVLTDPDDGILRSSEFKDLRWDEQNRYAPLADILRIHEWNYVRRIQRVCSSLPDEPTAIGHLDSDTAVCQRTWRAALAAAGACCYAVDAVMSGQVRNAFCAIRPPGHHAGPLGTVSSANDPHGSQGFCIFNNIAIAGAYAANLYRHQGVRRIALLDFDVHHGNGTQACIARVVPHIVQHSLQTPLSDGHMSYPAFHPWVDEEDKENILFASVQGYGKRPALGSWMYPGSGATYDTHAVEGTEGAPVGSDAAGHLLDQPADVQNVPPDDPNIEFAGVDGEHPPPSGPRVINVGIAGPGSEVAMWRRAWRDKILPAISAFKPDFMIISAGFDAHKKDDLNCNFIGITERDYYWLTQQLVAVANKVCHGRIISALEGGYRIQGGIVSAFSRSVAAHVRALSERNSREWRDEDAIRLRVLELQRKREILATKRANAAKAAKKRAAEQEALAAAAVAATDATADDLAERIPDKEDHSSTQADLGRDDASDRRKRRRGQVDYAALNQKIEEEESELLGAAKKTISAALDEL